MVQLQDDPLNQFLLKLENRFTGVGRPPVKLPIALDLDRFRFRLCLLNLIKYIILYQLKYNKQVRMMRG
jgi:hypothetical protein